MMGLSGVGGGRKGGAARRPLPLTSGRAGASIDHSDVVSLARSGRGGRASPAGREERSAGGAIEHGRVGFDMRNKLVGMTVAAALLAGGATLALAAGTPAAKPQTTCPVTGKAIDPKTSPHVDWQGQRIYFADAAAADAFRKDPEKVFATIAAEGVTLQNIQTVCPVSGEKLEGGDMGDPVSVAYKGRTVMFCCPMCPPKFEKDPAKYLAKLPGEQSGKK